jgi:hypothetical protein
MVRVFATRLNCADTPDLSSALDVMGTMQGDVLGRLLTDVEKCNPQLGGVLVRCSAAHPLHTGVVGDVIAIRQHSAAFNLPAHSGIVDVSRTPKVPLEM